MKKLHLINTILFAIGIGCMIAYRIIGSKVAANGTLVEPFALIPIGWLFIILGIILSLVLIIRRALFLSSKNN